MSVTIIVSGNLFAVAANYLGDATQWNRIAALNQLSDPWLTELTTIELPPLGASTGGGVGFE